MPDISEASVGEDELALVYIAREEPEAEKAEDLLQKNRVEYYTRLEAFRASSAIGALFETADYCGIGFYVLRCQEAFGKSLFEKNGMTQGLIDESE